jgi:hypothetical protein
MGRMMRRMGRREMGRIRGVNRVNTQVMID